MIEPERPLTMAAGNLFDGIAAPASKAGATPEQLATILSMPAVRIERIVSWGNNSPEGFWYDQQEHEWVLLLQGEAELEIEADTGTGTTAATETRSLRPGDFLLLPARCRHRVKRTSAQGATVWLALFFK